MGTKPVTLAMFLIASMVVMSGDTGAITLGELRAVSGSHPPYAFRVAILSTSNESGDVPSITVRQPYDAIFLMKNHTLELWLRSLTDVELEIKQGGQILNRLLLKNELQAAWAEADATATWNRYQEAKVNSPLRGQLVALLDSAYQAHQAWGQFAPSAAQQALTQIEQERRRLLAASGSRSDPIMRLSPVQEGSLPVKHPSVRHTESPLEGASAEREVQAIRAAIHNLTARVTPWVWVDTERRAGYLQRLEALPVLPLLLAGVLLAGVTSLFTAYLMHRQRLDFGRQRKRARIAARARVGITPGTSPFPMGQQSRLSEDKPPRQAAIAIVRHVRVSQKTRRRILVHTPQATQWLMPQYPMEQTQLLAYVSHTKLSTAAELIEALVNLRQELLRWQQLSGTENSPQCPDLEPK